MRAAIPMMLALALGGCVSDPAAVESASVGAGVASGPGALATMPSMTKNMSVDAPTWRVGDAWLVKAFGINDGEASALVVANADTDYELLPTSESLASFDAMFDISYVGRIRGADLAGGQQGQPIQFFNFPLEDGKTWKTTWDGQELTLRAGFDGNITTPLGKQPGFTIQGTLGDGATYLTYDYVPALRWWSRLAFEGGYGFEVTGIKANWTGEVIRGTAKQLLILESQPPTKPPAGTFKVDADQTSVVLTRLGGTGGGPSMRSLVVLGPDHQPMAGTPSYQAATARESFFELYQFPPKAGDWQVLAPAIHDTTGYVAVTLHQVALVKQQV